MVRVLGMLIFSLLMFGGGLGSSWYLFHYLPQQQATGPATPQTGLPANPTRPVTMRPADKPDNLGPENLPPIPTDRQVVSAEEIFRFGETYRAQYEALEQQQEEVRQEKLRAERIYHDVRGLQRELEGFQSQLEATLNQAQTLLEQIQQRRQELQQQREQTVEELQEAEQQRTAMEQEEMANLKKMASWFQQMEPEKAAEILVQYSNEGKLDTAIKLLSFIEERNVAKILTAIEDSGLSFQLTERYMTLKQPKRSATQR